MGPYGSYSETSLRDFFCEEFDEPDKLDRNEAMEAIRADLEQLRAEQTGWPAETDCDRLDRVFEALNLKGIIALQNAGYTQSDGYEHVCRVFRETEDPSPIRGFCFYHAQDLERAARGARLFLAFGPMDPEKEETDGLKIGADIVNELERYGFQVKWDGTFKRRILIENFDWKKRIA